jgi:2-dehydro-3-deoxygluconokinase
VNRFVAIGECMVELAPAEQPGQFSLGFAGDTFNTAWYIRRALGSDWRVDYVTALGQDALSDQMVAFIGKAGIGTGFIQRLPDRTPGLYMINLTGAERSFSYWRDQSAALLLARDHGALQQALAGARLIYLSGITLAILEEPDRATLFYALDLARKSGSQIAFDSNLRPRLWTDKSTMCDAVMRCAAVADIAMPSFEDEATAFGDTDPGATAARYAGAGVPLVVVKNGAGPVLARTIQGTITYVPPRISAAVDTTAAGDSFNAGFLAAHLGGMPLEQALASGSRVSGRVIGVRGALVT